MYLYTIKSVTAHDDTFTQCSVFSSGGAIYMYGCSEENEKIRTFHDCRFLVCKGDSGYGGGVRASSNKQYKYFLTNSLFSECSNWSDGALYLSYSSSSYSTSSRTSKQYPVKNCFFNRNYLSDTDGYGNDVLFWNYSPIDDPKIFLNCFSTSDSHRVGYGNYLSSKYNYYSEYVILLPLSLLMQPSERSYGITTNAD